MEVSDSEEEGTRILPSLRESDEEDDIITGRASRYKLYLEEVDDLLQAIYTTLKIQALKVQNIYIHEIYQGLDDSKHRVFPVHKVLSEAVKKE